MNDSDITTPIYNRKRFSLKAIAIVLGIIATLLGIIGSILDLAKRKDEIVNLLSIFHLAAGYAGLMTCFLLGSLFLSYIIDAGVVKITKSEPHGLPQLGYIGACFALMLFGFITKKGPTTLDWVSFLLGYVVFGVMILLIPYFSVPLFRKNVDNYFRSM